jgi:hypothetical protein
VEEAHALLLSSYLASTLLPFQERGGVEPNKTTAKSMGLYFYTVFRRPFSSMDFFPADQEMWVVAYRDLMANSNRQ